MFSAIDSLTATGGKWDNSMDEDMAKLTLLICDNMEAVTAPIVLVNLGEFCTSRLSAPDFAILSQVIHQSGKMLDTFSANEFVALLSLCSRVDYVDSDFIELVQQWLPAALSRFSANQLPVVFASVLRMGIDQPIDRLPQAPDDKAAAAQSSPLMVALVGAMIDKIADVAEPGCLTILHSIVRRPKSKITPEMTALVNAISANSHLANWGLAMRIQAVHTLSRLGVDNQPAIASLLAAVTKESLVRIPSANLQHLLSIIHNHASVQSELLWRPVLFFTVERIGQPFITRSMQMATIAVTIGYLGRLNVRNERVIDSLLSVFTGAKTRGGSVASRISLKMIERILTDSQVDMAHLTGIVEALDRLSLWDSPLAVPLAMVTRRIAIRDGLHNVKAAPLCQLAKVLLRNDFHLTDNEVSDIDRQIDQWIDEIDAKGSVSSNWALQSTGESDRNEWRKVTVSTLLEGLLRHETYVRSTKSAIIRCAELKGLVSDPDSAVPYPDLPENVRQFLDSVSELMGEE